MSSVERSVTLVCDACGCGFEVSARQARTIRSRGLPPKCFRHRRPDVPLVPVTDTERRYWLKRFDDVTLASFASALFDAPFRPSVFAERRAELLGTPDYVAASASSNGVAKSSQAA